MSVATVSQERNRNLSMSRKTTKKKNSGSKVLHMARLAKFFISILEGIIKKFSYERCDYVPVGEKSLSWAMSRKTTKKRF